MKLNIQNNFCISIMILEDQDHVTIQYLNK